MRDHDPRWARALADEGDLDGSLKDDRERTLWPRPAVKDAQ